MDPTVLNNQGLSFNTKDWTLDAYRRVLENEMIWRGFLNSFLYILGAMESGNFGAGANNLEMITAQVYTWVYEWQKELV